MQVSQFLTQGFIFSRPSDQNPVLPSFMLLKHKDRENRLDLMCRTKVIGIVVDVNNDECALTPYVDCEKKHARVVGPVWKNFAYDIICGSTVIFGVQGCCFYFDDDSLCDVVFEDIVAYVRGSGHVEYGSFQLNSVSRSQNTKYLESRLVDVQI